MSALCHRQRSVRSALLLQRQVHQAKPACTPLLKPTTLSSPCTLNSEYLHLCRCSHRIVNGAVNMRLYYTAHINEPKSLTPLLMQTTLLSTEQALCASTPTFTKPSPDCQPLLMQIMLLPTPAERSNVCLFSDAHHMNNTIFNKAFSLHRYFYIKPRRLLHLH